MSKRKKKYVPSSRFNPAKQLQRLDKLEDSIETHKRTLEALNRTHDDHISYLANFARHDIKNAILSMDSILTVTSPEEFNQEKIDSLSLFLEVISNTIENFSKLVPFTGNGKFKLELLLVAIELLTRADMQNNNIEMVLDFKRESDIELDLPFQTMLQIVNNLVHNSIKCLEGMENKTVYLNGAIDDNILTIIVADNGKIIPNEDISKIFEYGFSTTGGSGIGLYHANYICQQFNGQISIETDESEEYTKAFVIKLPIKKNGEDNINN